LNQEESVSDFSTSDRVQVRDNSPLDTHDEVNLGLSGDVEVSVSLGLPLQADLLSLLLLVVVDVLLGALEDDSALGLASLLSTNKMNFRQFIVHFCPNSSNSFFLNFPQQSSRVEGRRFGAASIDEYLIELGRAQIRKMVNCQRLTALHPRPTKALYSEVLSNLGILINNHCFLNLNSSCTRRRSLHWSKLEGKEEGRK